MIDVKQKKGNEIFHEKDGVTSNVWSKNIWSLLGYYVLKEVTSLKSKKTPKQK